LPGSREVFNFRDQSWRFRRDTDQSRVPLLGMAGRMGSVTRQSQRKQLAFNLLAWLSGKQWSPDIASRSPVTTLFRYSHTSDPRRWVDPQVDDETATGYVDLVAETQSHKLCLVTLRIPGVARYMAALDQAVHAAVTGTKTAQQALTAAAATWRQITAELGMEKQQHAYQQSLGLR
jgi:hypothetical protein